MPYNGWAFSHSFVEKFALFIRRYQKINEKEAGDGPFCKKMTMNVYGVIIFFIYLWTWMGRLNSWVVSHLALIIGTLCHALGHEFKHRWLQTLFRTQAQSMLSSWFYLVYLIWYYYLSVKFVIWIVKQKIENKQNLFKKAMGIDDSFLLAMTPWHILSELLTRYLVAHTRLVHVTYI